MKQSMWKAMGVAAVAVFAAATTASHAAVTITPSAGYNVTWDGNDGDYYTTGVAVAPANLSTAAGASAFTSGNLNVGPHTTPERVRDGFYGNYSSWIGSAAVPNYIGINLNGTFDLNAIAWGRDNGTSTANGDSAGGSSGQFSDRNLGTYTVQITNDLTPSTLTTNWTTVGTLVYDAVGNDAVVGGAFTPYFRHEYGLGKSGGPLLATGVRIVASPNSIAIDELELYGQSPVAQSGLRSWLRGDGDVTLSGPSITQVSDHSLNGNHATPGISPTVGSINGLPAAHFDSTNDHLNLPTTGPAGLNIANSDYEIFVIAKSTTSHTNVEFLVGGAVPNYELHLNGAAGARFIPDGFVDATSAADLGVAGQFSDGRAHLFNMRVDGDVGFLRVVGMENGDTVAAARSAVSSILTLGLRTNSTLNFVGDMGEVLVYNRALSEAERRQVERYLAAKWNAPLNVASQTQGGIAFANQVIAGGTNPSHQVDHLNNALYGNGESWLGSNVGGGGGFAGVGFDDAYTISALAFGRDATGASGDRGAGTYTFQFTRDDFDPTSLASVAAAIWTNFLVVTLPADGHATLRKYFEFDAISYVTGVRVLLSSDTLAIDELEIYGLVSVPTPTGAAMILGVAMLGLARRGRRSAA